MTRHAEWTHIESLPPGGRISPYIHWTSAWSHMGDALAAQDLLQTDCPWLARAIRKSLGDAAEPWARLLHNVLPKHALPSTEKTEGAAQEETPGVVHRIPVATDTVILGIIDDATAFAHERFRLPDGQSRVDYLWLQSAPHDPGKRATPFGKEFDRHGVEELIDRSRRGRSGEIVDEEGLYRAAGALDMGRGTPQSLARAASHGTAVADLAGGFSAAHVPADAAPQPSRNLMEIAPDAFDLAIVSLPERLVMDTSGTFAEIFIILGILRLVDHAEQRSQREGRDYPLVINISLGLTAGPRDGSSLLDRFIAAIEAERPRDRVPIRFVLPAGNFRQAQVHAVLEAPLDEAAPPLFWQILPDDRTPSFLEIWSSPLRERPQHVPFDVAIQPSGHAIAAALETVPLDGVFDLFTDEGRQIARCYTQWVPQRSDRPASAGRVRVTLALPPTVPGRPGRPCATPGAWRLLITSEMADVSDAGWPLDLVVQRDDMIPGYRGGGRQSFLRDARYTRVDDRGFTVTRDAPGPDGSYSHVRRAGTINAFASAPEVVVVGGCYADTLEPVDYSGEGGLEGLGLRAVDASAPSSMRRMRAFISAAGSRSGSRVGVGGTSIAAPVMSRELAKAMRPMNERPKLSGVPLLRRSPDDTIPPPVLPVGESTPDRYWEKSTSGSSALASGAS